MGKMVSEWKKLKNFLAPIGLIKRYLFFLLVYSYLFNIILLFIIG